MWRVLRRICFVLLLVGMFLCGFAVGSRSMEKVAETVMLRNVLQDSLDGEAAVEYLQQLLAQWDSEDLREAVESIAAWLKTIPN